MGDVKTLADVGGVQAPKGPPGSLLLFESNTLHASNANLSPWPLANRRAVNPLAMHDKPIQWETA